MNKQPCTIRFISVSSPYLVGGLLLIFIPVLLKSFLITIKELDVNFCNKADANNGINSWRVLEKKIHALDGSFNFVDNFDFSAVYTTLLNNL